MMTTMAAREREREIYIYRYKSKRKKRTKHKGDSFGWQSSTRALFMDYTTREIKRIYCAMERPHV